MSTLALILARAGSRGVPGKNLRPVAGRPCLLWTIDAAREALGQGVVDRIALSTDSPEAMTLALHAGVDTVARPPELASDQARVDDAARHAVETLEAPGAAPGARTHRFEEIVILYANVPVRPRGLIERAAARRRASRADSVQSYQPVGKHHPWWTAVVEPDGAVRPWQGQVLNHGVYRRQDLPPAHVPDGGVLIVTRAALFGAIPGVEPGPHAFFGAHRVGVINPEGSVIDIDTELDLLVASAVLEGLAP